MHIGLIADDQRLAFEHAMLNRLSVALIDEGAQLTRLVPEELAGESTEQEERNVALAKRVPVPMRVLPWTRHARARRLAAAIGKAVPDVLFAAGENAWKIGRDLAAIIGRPLVLEVWRLAQGRLLPRGGGASPVDGYIAPTQALAAALGLRVDSSKISVVPMGVSVPAQARPVLVNHDNAIAMAIVGSCSDQSAYRALFGALATLVRQFPQAHAFVELRGRRQHEVWQVAKQLDLLAHVSAIENVSAHRALLTRCDAMLLPERLGEVRSLTLEAMAGGVPIVASDDPVRDMLRDGDTAVIVPEPTVESWLGHMRHLLSQPERARKIGQAGRAWVSAQQRSSDQARTLLEALERIGNRGAYARSTMKTPMIAP